MTDDRPVLRIGHSPDPDDAFMWWPLTRPEFEQGRFRFEAVPEDIEALNQRSERAELEVTALSCAQYARVADRYALTACGASIGHQYGPMIVSARPMGPDELKNGRTLLAVPGERTSAFAAASVLLGRGSFRYKVVPFDRIIEQVRSGEVDAGLLIHEGQITFGESGLLLVADLGMWWSTQVGLPLPLGVNAIRRDLEETHGAGTLRQVAADLKRCLEFAVAHRDQALDYALRFARDLTPEQAGRFVDMYVNRWTMDLGPVGRAAVTTFFEEAHRAGLLPEVGEVDVIG